MQVNCENYDGCIFTASLCVCLCACPCQHKSPPGGPVSSYRPTGAHPRGPPFPTTYLSVLTHRETLPCKEGLRLRLSWNRICVEGC